ncbi:MAG: hypothetical protein H7330_12840 [Hymenobacteraceae bacterium]|nr:hypothetical protein [Hymenobacteraceae bacterium]
MRLLLLTNCARSLGARRLMLLLPVVVLLLSCGTTKPVARADTSTTNRPANRAASAPADPLLADVTRFRPKITATTAGTPVSGQPGTRSDVTLRADAQLDALAAAGRAVKTTTGFRILAYTGPSRDDAMKIRTAVIRRDPSEKDYLLYEQPTFRLKIGDYFTRLEAEQALARWRDVIPQGLIVAEQVNVR